MPERTARNPYTPTGFREGEAPNPAQGAVFYGNSRYAVPSPPDSGDPEWNDGAFSPELKSGGSSDGTKLPYDVRIGTREPYPSNGNLRRVVVDRNGDRWQREREDHTGLRPDNALGYVQKPRVPEWEQDIRPTRPTATAPQVRYTTEREWHIPRNAADVLGDNAILHISMADHRRTYPIMTMNPQGGTGVNTYRATPTPWDNRLFHAPPAEDAVPTGLSGNASFRLV